ncbi:ABC transporter ATP-binding protein [Nocardia tengchongensis]
MNPRAIDRTIAPLLHIEALRVRAPGPHPASGQSIPLVHGVDLDIWPGERVGLVGESGSGKSITARSIPRLDPRLTLSGSIRVAGREMIGATDAEVRDIRGQVVAMVFQDPLSALNPVLTVGDQITESLVQRGVSARRAADEAARMLDRLGVADARRRLRAYPSELSGGQRQRVVLAAALIGQPALLIADEPTTALDVEAQDQVLDLVVQQSDDLRVAVLLITHDLGVVAGTTDRVYVMRAGRIVENALVDDLFARPSAPYTRALLDATPTLDRDPGVPLVSVAALGLPAETIDLPNGAS